jgi:hypothetical protein
MAEATVRIGTTTKKRLVRAAATTAAVVATLLGATATAFAAEQAGSWQITGSTHTASSLTAASSAAEADLPALRTECRQQDGTPTDSAIAVTAQAPYNAYAIVTCQALRP